MADTPIDWSAFDRLSEHSCECRCGRTFRSHCKGMMVPTPHIRTRKPCPGCGKCDDVRIARSDPETFTIGGKP